MNRESTGKAIIVAAFGLIIATDLASKILWFSQYGFSARKVGSLIVAAILFYFACRGSAVARWLTVALGVLAVLAALRWQLQAHGLGLVFLASSLTSTVLLCLPAVTAFQRAQKQPQAAQ